MVENKLIMTISECKTKMCDMLQQNMILFQASYQSLFWQKKMSFEKRLRHINPSSSYEVVSNFINKKKEDENEKEIYKGYDEMVQLGKFITDWKVSDTWDLTFTDVYQTLYDIKSSVSNFMVVYADSMQKNY